MARKGREQTIMQKQGDVAVVSLLNKRLIDSVSIQAMYEELQAIAKDKKTNKIVLNMDGVEYLSSAVLGKLISLLKLVKKGKGDLRLCNIHPNVVEIFNVTQLDKIIGIHKGVKEAVAAIDKRTLGKKRGWLPW